MKASRLAAACLTLSVLSAAAWGTAYTLGPNDDWYSVLNGDGLSPGDEVVLSAGTYFTPADRMLTFGHMGTAEAPIVIRAADGADVTFTRGSRGSITDYWYLQHNVINILGARHLTLRGLEVTGGNWGIRIGSRRTELLDPTSTKLWDAQFVTIEYCHVHHTQNTAISANFPGDVNEGMVFRGNEVSHTGGHGEGFYLGGNYGDSIFHGGLIENNYIHDLLDDHNGVVDYQGDGIEIKDHSYDNIVRNNVIHDTHYPGVLVYGAGGGGSNIIEGNVIWNTRESGIQAAADAIIRNNIIYSCAIDAIRSQPHQSADVGNLFIYHNTLISDGAGRAIRVRPAKDGLIDGPVVIANNAVYRPAGDAILVEADSVSVLTNVASADLAADFADVAGLDFFPAPGSTLIGAADTRWTVELDYNGTARAGTADAGAYVYDPAGNPGRGIGPWLKAPPWHVGDANGDGVVGIADLSALADHYGQDWASWSQGDFSGDRVVGIADLAALADNYGWTATGGTVPEPGMIGLLAVGAGAVVRRRRRGP